MQGIAADTDLPPIRRHSSEIASRVHARSQQAAWRMHHMVPRWDPLRKGKGQLWAVARALDCSVCAHAVPLSAVLYNKCVVVVGILIVGYKPHIHE